MHARVTMIATYLGAAAMLAATAGCTTVVRPGPAYGEAAPVEVMAPRSPPPPRVEVVPTAPGEVYVWRPGYWHWNGRDFVWIAGHYIERPHRRAAWVADHWEPRAGHWVLVPGHWG